MTKHVPGRAFPQTAGHFESGPALTARQQQALAELELLSGAAPITCLFGASGTGKTLMLREYARRHSAEWLTLDQAVTAVEAIDPAVHEETILIEIERVLGRSNLLVIDDILGFSRPFFDRRFVNPPLWKRLLDIVVKSGKRLVFGSWSRMEFGLSGTEVGSHIAYVELGSGTLRADDYAVVGANLLGAERASRIDFELVYRFASGLNARELALVCRSFRPDEAPTTGTFIEGLSEFVVSANTRLEEVEELTFDSLPGTEHIASKLETHIILPLDNQALAQELDIRPKRGVLLYGPPGTGKTSIGRALAHQMKGKFFLIDGSFTTEPPIRFFGTIKAVVEAAKESAPAVLFIDDADVLFTIPHIAGFGRYLLSLLDGLESETANKVCLMMTAMDVRKVPSAILRSGRVELWLETRLPDAEARARILKRWMSEDLPNAASIDYPALAQMARNFTPADLRRIVSDAKAYYAVDQVSGLKIDSSENYLRRAIEATIDSRNRMADNLNDDTMRVGAAIGQVATK